MVTDAQVRVLRRRLMEGKTQEAAAAGAGMSVRSARQWQTGPYPSQARERHGWRTRPHPFREGFESEVAPLLASMRSGCWKRGRYCASSIGVIQERFQQASYARYSAGYGSGGGGKGRGRRLIFLTRSRPGR